MISNVLFLDLGFLLNQASLVNLFFPISVSLKIMIMKPYFIAGIWQVLPTLIWLKFQGEPICIFDFVALNWWLWYYTQSHLVTVQSRVHKFWSSKKSYKTWMIFSNYEQLWISIYHIRYRTYNLYHLSVIYHSVHIHNKYSAVVHDPNS